MTPYETIYSAFLSKILEDEWVNWEEEEIEADFQQILKGALPYFKFPRKSLDTTDEGFTADLDNEEIQIIATYMKCEWLNRTILTWENVKPLYEERDFSQANLIDKLNALLDSEHKKARRLESIYYRSVNHKPFDYTRLAGGNGK